jgi:ABC-type proline/glycine betaine transport system ATPase subunit
MTVMDNILTVPRLLGWDDAVSSRRGRDLLELFSLKPDDYVFVMKME